MNFDHQVITFKNDYNYTFNDNNPGNVAQGLFNINYMFNEIVRLNKIINEITNYNLICRHHQTGCNPVCVTFKTSLCCVLPRDLVRICDKYLDCKC